METQPDKAPTRRRKWIKRSVRGSIALATIIGTYSAREGDFAPFYVRHTGDSYGISVGIVQKFDEGARHDGLVISGYTLNRGKINGAAASFVNGGRGTINGLELGFFNLHYNASPKEPGKIYGAINGIQAGLVNNIREANGFQIGIGNNTDDGSKLQIGLGNISDIYNAETFQIGIVNFITDEEKTKKFPMDSLAKSSILVNWDFNNETLKE